MDNWILQWFHRAQLAVAVAAGLVCGLGAQAAERPLLVAAAANAEGVQRELARLFVEETGVRVETTSGSTGTLYAQIRNGAPFDIFLAADAVHPARLEDEGFGVAGTRFTYASGRVALFTASPDIADGMEALREGRFTRLALPNPALAPYGAAAVQALEALGVWDAVEPKVVTAEAVTQALEFVRTGNAELGFVAYAQVKHVSLGRHWLIPETLHDPLDQQAILLERDAPHPAAQAYLDFLKSAPAQDLLARAGYDTAPPGSAAETQRTFSDGKLPFAFDLRPVWVTLRLALVTTLILLIVGTPLAWWLARGASWPRTVVAAIVALPLVLPPTVLGFYLLILLGPRGWVGGPWEAMGGARLVFSFPGLVIGSVLFSLPFVVQPLQNAFISIGARPLEVAATLRARPLDRFFTVAVPLARPGFITAAVLGFAHTVGEFGVVLMIGGSIPGRTKVVSIAIYDNVESLQYDQAHLLSAGVLAFSFAVLLAVFALNRRSPMKFT